VRFIDSETGAFLSDDISVISNSSDQTLTALTSTDNGTLLIEISDADSGATDLVGISNPTLGWLSLDVNEGIILGRPTQEAVGQHEVTLTISDSDGAVVEQELQIVVFNVNDAPELMIDGLPDSSQLQGISWSSDLSEYFRDIDLEVDPSESLTYVASGLPGNYVIDGVTGEISGTSTNDDVGDHQVTVTATDVAGEFVSSSFTLTVNNVNDAPTVVKEVGTVQVLAEYEVDLSEYFQDIDLPVDAGEAIVYAIDGELPDGYQFNTATGLLAGSVIYPQDGLAGNLGIYTVTATATDIEGSSASLEMTLELLGFELTELGSGDDVFFGGDANDRIVSGGGADRIYAGAGEDIVVLSGDTPMDAYVDTGAGDDVVEIAEDFTGSAQLFGAAGNDRVVFSAAIQGHRIDIADDTNANLTVSLADGNSVTLLNQLEKDPETGRWVSQDQAFDAYEVRIKDPISGEYVSEVLTLGSSLFVGTVGDDPIDLTVLNAEKGEGEDLYKTVFGLDGDDTITGADGAEMLDGGLGDDVISGGAGDDTIKGGAGDDVINGGAGNDLLDGGSGDDTYVHSTDTDYEDKGLDRIVERFGGDNDTVEISAKLWDYASGDITNPFDDDRWGRIRIDENGDLIIASVRNTVELEADNTLEEVLDGIVIDGFASLEEDGSYRNTVEKLIVSGEEYRLDPDAVVSADDPEGNYALWAMPTSTSGVSQAEGGLGDDLLFGSWWSDDGTADARDVLLGGTGSDEFWAFNGQNTVVGGKGDDLFVIGDYKQTTTIIGDEAVFGSPDDYTSLQSTMNADWTTDHVQIGWSKTESFIESIAGFENAYRITKVEGLDANGERILNQDQVVEIYDIETVEFWDGETFGTPYTLSQGNAVGSAQYLDGYQDQRLDVKRNEVEFRFGEQRYDKDGNLLETPAANSDYIQLWAKVYETVKETHTTTETESYVYYQRGGQTRPTPARGWARRTGTREVEVQTTVDVLKLSDEKELIWEGDRFTVSKFNFYEIADVPADATSLSDIQYADTTMDVNVTNIAADDFVTTDAGLDASASLVQAIYIGTDRTDIIFGDDADNVIDGRGGNDYIFGGGGDDTLIGGLGDDVLLGGDGHDTLRGDAGGDDLQQLVQSGKNQLNEAEEGVLESSFIDEGGDIADLLELAKEMDLGVAEAELQEMAAEDLFELMSGDDLLIGGEGVDDIATGAGDDLAATDRVDYEDADGNLGPDTIADLDTINEHWNPQDEILKDDGWV